MRRDRLWVFAILPAVVLNMGLILASGAYFALAAMRPEWVAGVSLGQFSFGLSLFICVAEWGFASLLIRQLGLTGTRELIAPKASFWRFCRLPALIVFVVLNAIFAAYVAFTIWAIGSWYRIEGLAAWQVAVMLILVPVTAGFCEELIWRGYLLTRLEARGHRTWRAIALSAVSFALIHGVFLPDKVLTTLLFGIVAGIYYARARTLLPLMMTHIVMDVWSFGLSVL